MHDKTDTHPAHESTIRYTSMIRQISEADLESWFAAEWERQMKFVKIAPPAYTLLRKVKNGDIKVIPDEIYADHSKMVALYNERFAEYGLCVNNEALSVISASAHAEAERTLDDLDLDDYEKAGYEPFSLRLLLSYTFNFRMYPDFSYSAALSYVVLNHLSVYLKPEPVDGICFMPLAIDWEKTAYMANLFSDDFDTIKAVIWRKCKIIRNSAFGPV